MKKAFMTIIALAFCAGAFAQEQPALKWYGFVRTYFAFDTRESSAGTEDLYYYMPKPKSLNAAGEDVNAIPSFRCAALTSRLGLDINGGEFNGYKLSGKIEADFYSFGNTPTLNLGGGISGSASVKGTALMRLRQAYVQVAKDKRTWKVGQAWHPMAENMPDIFSLEIGIPFGPFCRCPQVRLDYQTGEKVSLTAGAFWQMQYTSTGPNGASDQYGKYSCAPELYLGMNVKNEHDLFRFGVDMLSIKPRNFDAAGNKVSDRITTFSTFIFNQYKNGNWTSKTKVTFAQDGSNMNMVGGYGVSEVCPDGSLKYSATNTVSAWTTLQYKKKDCPWVPSIFIGYLNAFGTSKDIIGSFYKKNSADTVQSMFRIQPEILYNLGKLQIGAEYMLTGVNYGTPNARKLAENTELICNHRIQMMFKFSF